MKNLKYAIYFVLFSIFAYVVSLPYLAATMKPLLETETFKSLGIELDKLLIAQGANLAITAFMLSLIGVILAKRVRLKWDWIQAFFDRKERPKLERKTVLFSIIASFIACLILSVLLNAFSSLIPNYNEVMKQLEPQMSWWVGLTTIFQGGVMEEVMVRFGAMTLIIWILTKIFIRNNDGVIPSWIYVVAIVLSSLVFGAGHLGAAQMLFGTLTVPLTVYIILGNSVAGLLFGYLYWKNGLEYAIIAHMVGDFTLHFFVPLTM